MKFFKSISLFFFYPFSMFLFGLVSGLEIVRYEYSRQQTAPYQNEWLADTQTTQPVETQVWSGPGTLSADTEYVTVEMDVTNHNREEIISHTPKQYIGMNREQFLMAIENYSNYPPLSEQERGFVSAEVISFAKERVVVQMNYQSASIANGFYLAVCDHEVVVYLEDQENIYMNTGILLESLPESIQFQIMDMLYIESEEKLYQFLETYSS